MFEPKGQPRSYDMKCHLHEDIVGPFCTNSCILESHSHIAFLMDTSAQSVDMFKQLDRIPYYDEVKIFKATIAYRRINSESPGYLTNMLKLNSSVNNRVTRYSNLNFLCPKYKRETEGGRTFTVTTKKQWNQLPIK